MASNILHNQEVRTVNKIVNDYIYVKVFKKGHVLDLGKQLVEEGLLREDKWTELCDQKFGTKDILRILGKKLRGKYTSRDILLTWIGEWDEKELKSVLHDETRYAIKEIHNKHIRDGLGDSKDFYRLDFEVGGEKGPNCVFDALMSILDNKAIKDLDDLKEKLVNYMVLNQPDDKMLTMMGLKIPTKTDWALHCSRFRGKNIEADVSVLYAASAFLHMNIHIIHITHSSDESIEAEVFIIRSHSSPENRNFFLGFLGTQRYVSLNPTLQSEFYDAPQKVNRKIIEKQKRMIEELKIKLKETQRELAQTKKELKTLKEESKEFCEKKTNEKEQEEAIKRLINDIEKLTNDTKQKEAEHAAEKSKLEKQLNDVKISNKKLKDGVDTMERQLDERRQKLAEQFYVADKELQEVKMELSKLKQADKINERQDSDKETKPALASAQVVSRLKVSNKADERKKYNPLNKTSSYTDITGRSTPRD